MRNNLIEQHATIKNNWNNSLFGFFFWYSNLGKILSNQDHDCYEFYQAYLSSSPTIQGFIKLYLEAKEIIEFENNINLLNILEKNNIFNKDNFNLISLKDFRKMHNALIRLDEAVILNQKNFLVIAYHINPDILALELIKLNKHGILNDENRCVVALHRSTEHMAYALILLHMEGILNEENRNTLSGHSTPGIISFALIKLHKNQILNAENRNAIAKHPKPNDLADTLIKLAQATILNTENINLLVRHTNIIGINDGLSVLSRKNILTQENFIEIANHRNPWQKAQELFNLHVNLDSNDTTSEETSDPSKTLT